MSTVTVTDIGLMKRGDPASILIFNPGVEDINFEKGNVFNGVVYEVLGSEMVTVNFMAGDGSYTRSSMPSAEYIRSYDITVQLTPAEYIRRTNALHAERVGKLVEVFQAGMVEAGKEHDERMGVLA
jgi:hypothetical protein